MKVLITRASQREREESPVDGARQEMVSRIDRRTLPTFEEVRKQFWGKQFFEEGTDHRVENGMVCRTLPPRNEWVMDIEDIFALAAAYGQLMVIPEDSVVGIEWAVELCDPFEY